MSSYTYLIAGHAVTSTVPLPGYDDFRIQPDDPRAADPAAAVTAVSDLAPYRDLEFEAHGELRIASLPDGGWAMAPARGELSAVLACSQDYASIAVAGEQALAPENTLRTMPVLRFALMCRLARYGVLSLHGACVETEGRAVVFTGYSGIGKSTRAAAWVQAGSRLISGDRPSLRIDGQGSVLACGNPWDGKEQLYINEEYPLLAVLDVRRSDSTRVRRLSARQVQALLMRQAFVPMWDTETAFLVTLNVRRLARGAQVLRVFCGPDEAAARQVHQILYRNPQLILEERNDMKIKEGFVLRNAMGEHLVMPTGKNIAQFNGTVVLNGVSAFVFKALENPVSREDLLQLILDEYEVDEATAAKDLDALLAQFGEYGMLETD